ncbi:unnamed protein product [Adineta steineri]|uniref:PARP catalytic domain-containing protein n=1 Tax=Adineta steineri TaxID=433720 RepID=A0A819HUH9_9BILA|nr:unnamed protein product [Adineta steineri]CAF3903617.1 unnamed protein product [Adineta steineri]
MLTSFCLNHGTSTPGKFLVEVGVQPIRRMLTMRCNCPCYRTRPKLRLISRVVLLVLCVLLRIVASILYSQANRPLFFMLCAGSIVFLLISLAFDYYHYRVWWHYRPSNDNIHSRYSSKHRRFLPYHLLGENRNAMMLGNAPCSREPCTNRELEHILIYHFRDHRPQQRWFEIKSDDYIGFHQRGAEKAIEIAHSDFTLSQTPPQMLGFGIYFARSINDTEFKARQKEAIICAVIRMGKVRVIEYKDIPSVQNTNAWHQEYDTIYYKHINPTKDEFCIKSVDQILEWVMVIKKEWDSKVKDYRIDIEFSDTRCSCI